MTVHRYDRINSDCQNHKWRPAVIYREQLTQNNALPDRQRNQFCARHGQLSCQCLAELPTGFWQSYQMSPDCQLEQSTCWWFQQHPYLLYIMWVFLSTQTTYTRTKSKSKAALIALTPLAGHKEKHPACKNWVMSCWCGYLSKARCRLFAYCPADATASPKPQHFLPHLNPDWF